MSANVNTVSSTNQSLYSLNGISSRLLSCSLWLACNFVPCSNPRFLSCFVYVWSAEMKTNTPAEQSVARMPMSKRQQHSNRIGWEFSVGVAHPRVKDTPKCIFDFVTANTIIEFTLITNKYGNCVPRSKYILSLFSRLLFANWSTTNDEKKLHEIHNKNLICGYWQNDNAGMPRSGDRRRE